MEFLTVKETAQLLRVSPITVRRYIASGRLAAERVGRGIRVRREAIEGFVMPVEPDQFYWPRKPAAFEEEDLVEICSHSSPTGVMWVLIERLDDYLDEHVPIGDGPLGSIIGIGRSDGPNDVSSNKHKYLADACLSEFRDPEDDSEPDERSVEPFTRDDPLWNVFGSDEADDVDDAESDEELPTLREQMGNIIGIGRSSGPTDVSANKYEYLADAYESDRG